MRFFAPKMQAVLIIMRLDRPVGVCLCLFPAIWGLQIGAYPLFPSLRDIVLFIIGAFLVRAGGCILNDLWDKDFDRKVERTRGRPLPAALLTEKEAFILAGFIFFCAFGILLVFSPLTIFWGVLSVPLIALYPLFKRFTYWPQIFLGIIFNWGMILGWTVYRSDVSSAFLLLYGGAILWTIGYDTIYAHQDKEDDRLIGVKSSALVLKDNTKFFLLGIYTGSVFLWGGCGIKEKYSFPFYIFLGVVFLLFLWQSITLKESVPNDCLRKFKSNGWVGVLVSLAFLSTLILK